MSAYPRGNIGSSVEEQGGQTVETVKNRPAVHLAETELDRLQNPTMSSTAVATKTAVTLL